MKKIIYLFIVLAVAIASLNTYVYASNDTSSSAAKCSASVTHLGKLDQQQCVYNGGLSARTLAGYKVWQSFKAGKSGTLTEIDMGFFNAINGTGLLEVYAGQGTSGTVLVSKSVTVSCGGSSCMVPFKVTVPVVSGSVYTFQFTPLSGMPDPYGVQISSPGSYANGQLGVVDPSGTWQTSYDAVFSTFVK